MCFYKITQLLNNSMNCFRKKIDSIMWENVPNRRLVHQVPDTNYLLVGAVGQPKILLQSHYSELIFNINIHEC